MEFDQKQIERYSRNMVLAELGVDGQRRLRSAGVLIVGAGGLGSPALLYLAAAGVGRIGLIDPDNVELSNLQRQVAHDTRALGTPKVISAARRARELNPDVKVETWKDRLDSDNAAELIEKFDFVIDATDNFPAKYLINDACVLAGKPFSHAGVLKFGGQAFTWEPPAGKYPCLRCMLPEQPPAEETPTCAASGVLGAAVGVMGSVQAAEAVKFIAGIGERLTGKLLSVDTLTARMGTVRMAADPACPVCSAQATISTLNDSFYRR